MKHYDAFHYLVDDVTVDEVKDAARQLMTFLSGIRSITLVGPMEIENVLEGFSKLDVVANDEGQLQLGGDLDVMTEPTTPPIMPIKSEIIEWKS